MLQDKFRRELKIDEENKALVEMSNGLIKHIDEIEKINDDNGTYCINNELLTGLAVSLANGYINQDIPDYHPHNDRNQYFLANYKEIADTYFKNKCIPPEIQFKETTARSSHELMIQDIYRQSTLGSEQMSQLIEKDPNIELDVYHQISEDMYADSCNTWCEAVQYFSDKASEFGIINKVTPIKQVLNHNPMVKENIG